MEVGGVCKTSETFKLSLETGITYFLFQFRERSVLAHLQSKAMRVLVGAQNDKRQRFPCPPHAPKTLTIFVCPSLKHFLFIKLPINPTETQGHHGRWSRLWPPTGSKHNKRWSVGPLRFHRPFSRVVSLIYP